MERRQFGSTDLQLSVMGLGGLLARYEGVEGHPPPEEKRAIYLRAEELGINLFDMGYGDEVHIPDELKGPSDERYFSLKAGAPEASELPGMVENHLRNVRREAIDILRIHHAAWRSKDGLRETAEQLREAGKVRALCLIRHSEADQIAYAGQGPETAADGDLVVYNYVCRSQEPGLEQSREAGKGVLIMKALGGQWLAWDEQARTDWSQADAETVVRLARRGEPIRNDLGLVHPIVNGPWRELCEPGESVPPTNRAIGWVQQNPAVSCVLVAFASVAEVEEGVGVGVEVG
jgi:aryl-alcohol dehydrogenase-like predicted oxidoreductase